jgi:hypothetical protein
MYAARPLCATLAAAIAVAALLALPAMPAHGHSSRGGQITRLLNPPGRGLPCRRPASNVHRWTRPVADAGPDQATSNGSTVTLDGSRSHDADGDQLRYHWLLVKRPHNSRARLAGSDSVMPTLSVDAMGQYVIALLVRSCDGTSKPDLVIVDVGGNLAPVANAGLNQTVFVGEDVQLDGSASSDPNGDALVFGWEFRSRPAGSQATLSNGAAARPHFSPDVPGDYALRLTVSDGQLASAAEVVVVTQPGNSPPFAEAGVDQSSRIGQTVMLDARASTDPDGDPLTFSWTLVSQPDDSTTSLQAADTAQASFFVDVEGQYVTQVVVCDATACSNPDAVVVNAAGNSVPVAVPGPNQTVNAGVLVSLDGQGSSDPDGDALSFTWSLTSAPAGSSVQLDDPSSPMPSFRAAVPGDYILQLTVNDGRASSAPVTVTVTAVNNAPVATGDAAVTAEDTAVTIAVLENDSDANGDALSVSSVTQPTSGAVVISGGALRFTPNPDFHGAASFSYRVTDGQGGSDQGFVTVTVTPVNDAPQANADSISAHVNRTITILVLGNDTDRDGDVLAVLGFSQPTVGGTVEMSGSGLRFIPTANFVGTVSFFYTATDGALTSTGTVSVRVHPPELSISDAWIFEGNSGSKFMTFVVSLSEAVSSNVTFSVATTDETARASLDYLRRTGQLILSAGTISTSVAVQIIGDTSVEGDETFRIELSNANGTPIRDGVAVGVIFDDD